MSRVNGERTWCEISLDAILHNFKQFKGHMKERTKFMAVVKADAYGHGVDEIAHVMESVGADFLAVACVDEAIELRHSGISMPILVLGYTPPEYSETMVELDIRPTIYHLQTAQAMDEAGAKLGKIANIHVKIDTGMSRLGYCYYDDDTVRQQTTAEVLHIARLEHVKIEGLFTHFACADEVDIELTQKQFDRFCHLIAQLEAAGLRIPLKHACNSAAAMRFPQMHLDMVRVGISLYGLYPSEGDYDLDLIPAMQLKTAISNIKTVPPGESISYGATYQVEREMKIATIPIGYADGYSRLLSGKAKVIVNGQFSPVVGRICMDQCMIDVTSVNTIHMEDEVVLFGTKDQLSIPIEELANTIGTINYELLCVICRRIPRYYTVGGSIIEVHNYLLG